MDSLHLVMVIKYLNLQNWLCIYRDVVSSILACYWCIETPNLLIFINLFVLKFEIDTIDEQSRPHTIPTGKVHHQPATNPLYKVQPSTFVLCPICLVCLMLSDTSPVFEVNSTPHPNNAMIDDGTHNTNHKAICQ